MSSELQKALEIIRERANNTTEVGTAFEELSKIFLENDPTWTQQFSEVWFYEDWAKSKDGYSNKDVGIDLVAKLRGEEGYCAIQCKCYQSEHSISKANIDSFISASNTKDFSLLLLIDTSIQEIEKNAKTVFDNLTQEWKRIQLSEMEQCRIDWMTYVREDRVRLHSQKTLFDHQAKALEAVRKGLDEDDRGKIIMACGTGKTFTSLRIAEDLAGNGKRVLYMVPSLALMSQTVREWKNDAIEDFTAFSACSDIKVGKRSKNDDNVVLSLNDLAFPATTDASKLAEQIKNAEPDKMTVVFSTYHSIDVISRAQFEYDLEEFDLIICDEAHRTTGATLVGDDESNFVRIHSNDNVKGSKRLYMTATPRIFGETARQRADEGEVALASMDDEEIYGKTLFHRGFGWAVENNHLTDYKVVVLAVDEGIVADHIQRSWEEGSELKLDDATKMIGCYKALAKVGFKDGDVDREEKKHPPMKRALAFCQNIALSKMFSSEFMTVVNEYIENEDIKEEHKTDLEVELHHVDGTFNAERRNDRLNWLKDDTDKDVCRVLTNARCLSEGVDVPSLDAIMFLHPRKSQIDVVQSVGRVMRKAKGKDLGYVILPITVAPGVSAERALNDNEKYKVVWQILNALRAHDERLDGRINQMGLGEDVSDRIEIVGVGFSDELDATTAVVEDVAPKPKPTDNNEEADTGLGGEQEVEPEPEGEQLAFVLDDLSQAIKAKIVDKCGTRDYWEDWASDIAKIAQAHITRINSIVLNSGTPERKAFLDFVEEIRDDLNPEISETDAVEMLAQHIITRPVFDTLFQGNNFTKENAVSKAMETVLGQLYDKNIDTENNTLQKFYDSVKRRSEGLVTAGARQKLILELYDRFFRSAFKKMTERLGIVYTPVEVVDFIIHSVNDILQDEFGSSLSDKGVHILDPFTGTGTFITRLMESGVINKEDLAYKYKNEIHANEIVLLAYYIAAINIESVYQDLVKENQYQPFQGIVLTDTFQLYEQEKDMVANLLPDNSNRRTAQKERDITVVVGNPPYSAGQKLANDDAAKITYLNLDQRIEKTYAAQSTANLKNHLYNSYIRAFRWASDRLSDEGVIGFVSGSGWIDKSFADGMRKCLGTEFSKIYLINLRGDINKNIMSGGTAGEGDNIFGSGSKTGIVLTILVKNKKDAENNIYYFDVGKNLKKERKLEKLKNNRSINSLVQNNDFSLIKPDEFNDWINQGDKTYFNYKIIGDKKKKETNSIFRKHSNGVKTQRDAWCYNFSKIKLKDNCQRMTNYFNSQVEKFSNFKIKDIKKNISYDPTLISWSDYLFSKISQNKKASFEEDSIVEVLYRPFTKTNLYFSKSFNDRQGLTHNIFPNPSVQNKVILINGFGSQSGFSSLMTNHLTDLNTMQAGQCFPLKIFEEETEVDNLFSVNDNSNILSESNCISKIGLDYFMEFYGRSNINEETLFYYVYGMLNSLDYKERFKNNLAKALPHIPPVKSFDDFMKYSEAGRKLSELHINYETVEPYQVTIKEGDLKLASISDPKEFYRIKKKMKFAGKRGNIDKTTVIYNNNITIQNIPLEAYEYVVNGKSALDWVMDRQVVKTDKKSGITNNANDYANETMNNPAYPLELFQRVITVSLETMKIVRALPKLDID
jgi:predicted helicase